MNFRKLTLRLTPLFLVLVVAIQLAIGAIFLPPKAHAETYSPEAKAAAWNVGMALANCAKDVGWDKRQTAEDLDRGQLFDSGPADFVRKTVGYITEKDDGTIACHSGSDIVTLFEAIDDTPANFLEDNKIYKYNTSAGAYDFNNSEMGSGGSGNNKSAEVIKNAIAKKFGFTYGGVMPENMQYAALYAAFKEKCMGQERESGGLAVWIVDNKGVPTLKHYTSKDGRNDGHVIEVGYSLSGDGGNDQKMTCSTIVAQMNKTYTAYVNVVKRNTEDDDPSNDSPDASTTPGSTTPADACSEGSGVMSWVMCPVITLVGSTLNWIDTQLMRLLEVDRGKYTSDEMYRAWSQFRNLGLTLLIAAMLVMVISTALGLSIFDAYTVKKAFPRMVAAIVFMTLSWYICSFLIDVVNVIGRGTLGLMTAPFGDKVSGLTHLFSGGTPGQYVGTALITTGALGVVGAPGIILSWLATGALIMGIAFLVLVARQMFIIVLILFSPLAILAWIFPGNDKLWKFWWQSFSKLLLMFPLVMALIASGRIFAGVIAEQQASGLEGGLLNPLLKLTAYILPYAFIPFTFKAAGGAFGNLVGMANDRSRGAFDRLRKGRQRQFGAIGRNMKAGQGFRGERGNVFNRLSSGAAAGPMGWVSANRRNASRETGMAIAGAASTKESQVYDANKGNDMFLLAAASERLARQKISELENKQAGLSGEELLANQREIAARKRALAMAQSIPNKTAAFRRQAALDLAATGYQFSDDKAGYDELTSISREINGSDDAAHANFMNNAQYNLKTAGRYDLAGINNGAGWDPDAGTNKASLYELANGKGGISTLTHGLPLETVDAAGNAVPVDASTWSQDQVEKAAIAQNELRAMLPNSKGAVKKKIQKQLDKLEASGVSRAASQGYTVQDPQTGLPAQQMKPTRVAYNNMDPNHATWSDADKIRGYMIENQPVTIADVAQAKARTMERTDPNILNSQ